MSVKFSRILMASAALGAAAAMAAPGAAQQRPTDPSTVDILEVLVETGVLTREQADAVLAQARQRAEQRAEDNVVRVPYVPQAVREQIREEVRDDVIRTARSENWAQPDALPDWLGRFTLYGDVRTRAEVRTFQDNNAFVGDFEAINAASENGADGFLDRRETLPRLNTEDDRFRARVRARLGVGVRLNDWADAGVRLSTGNDNNPASANDTLDDNFDRLDVSLDRAFLRLRPFEASERFAGSALVFGQFDNPFVSTDLLFDPDLAFQGVGAMANARFAGLPTQPRLFASAGVFPLEEIAFDGNQTDDKTLFGGQVGIDLSAFERLRLTVTGGYFHYDNVRAEENPVGLRINDPSAPQGFTFGNTLINIRNDNALENTARYGLAAEFEVVSAIVKGVFDLTADYAAHFEAEYAVNTAFDRGQLVDLVPGQAGGDIVLAPFQLSSSGDTAYHLRLGFGHKTMDRFASWSLSGGYRYLEADSTYALFTDSRFGLQGTDQEGFTVEGRFGLGERVWLRASWLSARTIDYVDPFTGVEPPAIDVDTFLIDLNGRF